MSLCSPVPNCSQTGTGSINTHVVLQQDDRRHLPTGALYPFLAMKFLGSVLVALAIAASLPTHSEAFTVASTSKLSSSSKASAFIPRSARSSTTTQMPLTAPPQLSMVYSVAIVGATGAVGKEIRTCLEARNFPVSKLRIFGSARSAGTMVETESYGTVEVELFDVAKARDCDVVFLAVSGEFALEHAEAIAAGDDGAVVIDNSVRCYMSRFHTIMGKSSGGEA